MNIIRLVLSPFSLLYQLILRGRNFLYDSGLFGVTSFDIPTISVGNLAFGGTGKTPHIEYLARLLKPSFAAAVLSRGYGRKTSGYLFAGPDSTVEAIGDEPWQIYNKFKKMPVAVSESRVLGLPNLLFDAPQTQVVLLDDAFQHRAIQPGLNILLTDYNNRFTLDWLAPAGTLREYRAAYARAQIIIVSKCRPNINVEERTRIIAEIRPFPHQSVYFSYLSFGEIVGIYQPITVPVAQNVLVFAAIANPQSFLGEIKQRYPNVVSKFYPDHYAYKPGDIETLVSMFEQLPAGKIIVTTEKDRAKLMSQAIKMRLAELPVFYLPVEVDFFQEDKAHFNNKIIDYVAKHSTNV